MVNPDFRINTTNVRSPDSSSESKRPTGAPDSSKNFEKVMNKDRREGKQEHKEGKTSKKDEDGLEVGDLEGSSEGEEEAPVRQKPAGLFDLSRPLKPKPLTPQPFVMKAPTDDQALEENLVGMAENKMLAGKEQPKKFDEIPKSPQLVEAPEKDTASEGDTLPKPVIVSETPKQVPVKEKDTEQAEDPENLVAQAEAQGETRADSIKKPEKPKISRGAYDLASEQAEGSKEKIRAEISKERPDTTFIDPRAQSQQQAPLVNPMTEAKPVEVPRNTKDMKDLIDQIVKEMYVVKTGDVTDTVMTIRHPPIFEGAQVKITTFESARGEFNISFENLTQQAKDLLDNKLNRETLLLALNKEGYNVHIITTSTTVENPIFTGQAEKKDQEQKQGQGREQQQEQQKQQKKK